MIRITPMSSVTNSGPVTGKVPMLSGAIFLFERKPPSAIMGTKSAKRPKSVVAPSIVL